VYSKKHCGLGLGFGGIMQLLSSFGILWFDLSHKPFFLASLKTMALLIGITVGPIQCVFVYYSVM
jgi:hypothetical protein